MSNTKTIHWAPVVRLFVAGIAVASVFVMAKYLERDLDLQPGEALSAGLLLGTAIILAWTAWEIGRSADAAARSSDEAAQASVQAAESNRLAQLSYDADRHEKRYRLLLDIQRDLTAVDARAGREKARQLEEFAEVRVVAGQFTWDQAVQSWCDDLQKVAGGQAVYGLKAEEYRLINEALGLYVIAWTLVDQGLLDQQTFIEFWGPTTLKMRHFVRAFVAHKREIDNASLAWQPLLSFLDAAEGTS